MDSSADGYSKSEAVVSIFLQKKQESINRYASIFATKVSTDGWKEEGITYPAVTQLKKLSQDVMDETKLDPNQIKYVEAHMTGTAVGDVVESQALTDVFCQNRSEPLLIGCLKSNMGHAEAASGAAAIIKACLIFKYNLIPPNILFHDPNPNIEGLRAGVLKPVTRVTPFNHDLIAISNFGIGGTNTFCILKKDAVVQKFQSLPTWDHSKDYFVPKVPDQMAGIKNSIVRLEMDLSDPEYEFIMDHKIAGRSLFPAAGLLWIVWKSFHMVMADVIRKEFNESSVEFWDVDIIRTTPVVKANLIFTVNFLKTNHKFTLTENGSVCATGFVRFTDDHHDDEDGAGQKPSDNRSDLILQKKDIYKEFHTFGLDYEASFQTMEEVDMMDQRASVKFNHWISFVDGMIQVIAIMWRDKRLRVPVTLKKLSCDLNQLMKSLSNNDWIADVRLEDETSASCNGLKMTVECEPLDVKKNINTMVEKFFYQDYQSIIKIDSDVLQKTKKVAKTCNEIIESYDTEWEIELNQDDSSKYSKNMINYLMSARTTESRRLMLHYALDDEKICEDVLLPYSELKKLFLPLIEIAIQNMYHIENLQVMEITTSKDLMYDAYQDRPGMGGVIPKISYKVLHEEPEKLSKLSNILIEQLPDIDLDELNLDGVSLLIIKHPFVTKISSLRQAKFFSKIKKFLTTLCNDLIKSSDQMVLLLTRTKSWPFEENLCKYFGTKWSGIMNDHQMVTLIESLGFMIIASRLSCDGSTFGILIKKSPSSPSKLPIKRMEVTNNDISWIPDLQSCHPYEKEKIFLTSPTCLTGLIGFVQTLRLEHPNLSRNLRCITGLKSNEEIPQDLLMKDLVINVRRDEKWGCFLNETIEDIRVYQDVESSHLDVETKGDISSLKFFQTPKSSLTSDSSKMIDVYYSSLNFKDIMVASGRIPTSAYPAGMGTLGIEFSGVDSTGKRIMGLTNHNGIATEIRVDNELLIWDVPDYMSLKEAATIPVAYFTVYYSLLIRGNLQRGESVLIHSGTGAVGQAALHVCSSFNCNIFVTVGSEEKKKFLLKEFPDLKSGHILNSRSSNFEHEILDLTDGLGVDIVLNSLVEEKLKAGINCLSESGRFLEIGKYDIIQNSEVDMSCFHGNRSLHVICMAHLMIDWDKYISSETSLIFLKNTIQRDLNHQKIRPINSTIFQKEQYLDAFRYMMAGNHMGKILIQMRDEDHHDYDSRDKPMKVKSIIRSHFDGNMSYILIGGLGGFGLEIMYWMCQKGARKFIITSRSGIKNDFQKFYVERVKEEFGAQVLILLKNVVIRSDAYDVINEANDLSPVGGIMNMALEIMDIMFDDQTVETFDKTSRIKVEGTRNLDDISRDRCPNLKFFCCFSSIVNNWGNAGQTSYSYANSFMERLCELRQSDGLPGLAIQWGPVGDVGGLSDFNTRSDTLKGFKLIRIKTCIQVLDSLLNLPEAVYAVYQLAEPSVVSGVDQSILKFVYNILGIKNSANVDKNKTFVEIGIDSMLTVEIRQKLEREFNISLSNQEIRKMTLNQLEKMCSGDLNMKSVGSTERSGDRSNYSPLFSDLNMIFKENSPHVFTVLNPEIKSSKILFIAAPLFDSFEPMKMVATGVENVTLVAIRWTAECDTFSTIQQLATYYSKELLIQYPMKQYYLTGYSFGCTTCHAMAIELQKSLGPDCVKRVLYMDGSPKIGEVTTTIDSAAAFLMPDYFAKKREDEMETNMIFVAALILSFFQKIVPEDATIEELIQTMNQDLMLEDVTYDSLLRITKQIILKSEMNTRYSEGDMSEKIFNGDATLIRSTFFVERMKEYNIGDDYDLSKVSSNSYSSNFFSHSYNRLFYSSSQERWT